MPDCQHEQQILPELDRGLVEPHASHLRVQMGGETSDEFPVTAEVGNKNIFRPRVLVCELLASDFVTELSDLVCHLCDLIDSFQQIITINLVGFDVRLDCESKPSDYVDWRC